jgi:hypothetical protein
MLSLLSDMFTSPKLVLGSYEPHYRVKSTFLVGLFRIRSLILVSPLLGVERRDPLLTSSRCHTGGRRFPVPITQCIRSGLQPPLTMSQVVLSLHHLSPYFCFSGLTYLGATATLRVDVSMGKSGRRKDSRSLRRMPAATSSPFMVCHSRRRGTAVGTRISGDLLAHVK